MKRIKFQLLLALGCLLVAHFSMAQSPILHKYILGEGLNFSTKNYKMEIGGFVQPYMETNNFLNDSVPTHYSRFRMRRARLRLTGEVERFKIDYRFQTEFSGSGEADDSLGNPLMDAWIAYNPTKRIKIKFGQSATPTDNRELMMGSQSLQLVERSRVTSAFSTIREFGLFAEGTFKISRNGYTKSYLNITNGDGRNVFKEDIGGFKYGARIDFLPFGLFTNFGQYREVDMVRELTPKLVFGTTYSVNNGMSSRRGRVSNDIIYLSQDGKMSLPNFTKLGLDFLLKYKGFSMLGEFVSTSATVPSDIAFRVRVNGTRSSNFDVNGKQDVENYVKGRMMLGKGYNLQMGYLFANFVSVDVRYTHLAADRFSFLNNAAFYNTPNFYTFGATKFLNKGYGFKIQTSVTYAEINQGSEDVLRQPISGGKLTYQLLSSFAF